MYKTPMFAYLMSKTPDELTFNDLSDFLRKLALINRTEFSHVSLSQAAEVVDPSHDLYRHRSWAQWFASLPDFMNREIFPGLEKELINA